MSQLNHYQLGIGEIIIIRDQGSISTVLGSCVALCIYSLDGSIGGMNHFVLPRPDLGARIEDEYRYGEASCKALIDTILAQSGVKKSDLRAKIIGGASIIESKGISRDIGNFNIDVARKAIAKHGIPLVAEDVGGALGRKMFFFTETGKVRLSMLDKSSREVPKLKIPPALSRSTLPVAAVSHETARPSNEPVARSGSAKKRVLIVDDSKTIQEFLKKVFAEDPEIEVVGVANHPGEAETILASTKVDVMTLDIQMPVMDGVSFLEKLMPVRPMPVVMLTSMSPEDGNHVLKALDLGAVDYIQKPKLSDMAILGPTICEKVKAAANAHIQKKSKTHVATQKPKAAGTGVRGQHIVAIGASTGGTVALADVLTALPAEIPPIVIVQHIPPVFSKAFADRLNVLCPFEVKEAEDGDELLSGRVLIAPGGKQMEVVSSGGRMIVRLNDSEPVNRHKPSVDYLFDSVARLTKGKSLGIILTGMGADGARGMLAMKQAGCHTVAQDEKSCVVYGMPKEAVKLGGVDQSAGMSSTTTAFAPR
ncbi:MAG: chemotaxis-specific protein-glutamate methyltransferase CheB [Proteobacteria bacterium]|nr:MAG: chemotaxis-specific protein-glutamate methyltransferase CheB [Pseudomonadota bacterium]